MKSARGRIASALLPEDQVLTKGLLQPSSSPATVISCFPFPCPLNSGVLQSGRTKPLGCQCQDPLYSLQGPHSS